MMRTISILMIVMMFACKSENMSKSENPFYNEWDTPFGIPPFDQIDDEHYLPAFKEGIKQQEGEIKEITTNSEDPTFENTLVALDESGQLYKKVIHVFENIINAHTSDNLQQIASEIKPLKAAHEDNINLNPFLFERIKTLYDKREELDLTKEQYQLLEKKYKTFVRGGANLPEDQKERLRDINKRLSVLKLEFGNNILAETNAFELIIEDKNDLSGIPAPVINSAAVAAKEKGYEDKWLFTIQKPSMIPFLQYADNRDLREKIFKGYIMKGDHDDENDNKGIITEIIKLRIEKANMLGYDTHAEYILNKNMARTSDNVYDLLLKVWNPALEVAKKEASALQEMIYSEGKNFELKPWDWWYYAEKVRKEKFNLSEDELRPYFELEKVKEGLFEVANRLFGIHIKEINDIPLYHKDANVYEVTEANGEHVGVLITDYYIRDSKRAGAWMDAYRKQYKLDGKNVSPIIVNVCNFSRPTANDPTLLSFDQVLTMFHEFGHGLHGLLSDCSYYDISGTSVPRDFVELPSQIMENWVYEPEVLKIFARHYKTDEVIPDGLIEKLQKSIHFNQGFATVEFIAAGLLDMDWHTLSKLPDEGVNEFETSVLRKYGLIPEIVVRYRSTYFAHIFSGGYSAGYYSYLWSEVLDADAFQAFKETSLFDQSTANSFRENILSKGGTDDPMNMYINFRGREPRIEPLLRRKGF